MKIIIPKELVKLILQYAIHLAEEVAKQSKNPYDDMVVQFLKESIPILLSLIDQLYEQV